MRRIVVAIGFEVYALLLAGLQALGGIRTDEAKYLLNIPYPHPPLARFLLSLTAGLPFQEMFWRIVFASLLVQAVWIVEGMAKGLHGEQRLAAMGGWLLCAAVLLQAGSIMMAPLTALEGLLLLALLFRARRRGNAWSPWMWFGAGVLWAASLTTAFQAVLYLPVVVALFARAPLRFWQKMLYVTAPLLPAVLFALANPLILQSFLLAGGQNGGTPLLTRAVNLFQAWCIGGSIVLGIVGITGMILDRQWALLASVVLVCTFVFLSFRLYYAILFTPLFVAGAIPFIRRFWHRPLSLPAPILLITFLCLLLFPPQLRMGPARATMAKISERQAGGDVLIAGSFGHEWQYESPFPVLRYNRALLPQAQAVVCLDACDGIADAEGWRQLPGTPAEVWVREAAIGL